MTPKHTVLFSYTTVFLNLVIFLSQFYATTVYANANAFNSFDKNTYATSSCAIKSIAMPLLTDYFAAPSGTSKASGTYADPLDLSTALSADSPLKSGQTLWLLEGTYSGAFTSELRGNKEAPILVKPYPGKRVIIDSTEVSGSIALRINGSWVHYYGLEVLSRNSNRTGTTNDYATNGITLSGGVDIYGAFNKVINFISHDNASGINAWYKGENEDTEIYGSIIYNNGWTAPGRGHGHAIYAQNRGGTKKLTNNIIFFGFGTGIHVYTEGGSIENFDIQDNVWFLTGASDPRASQKKDNCLVGGYQPVKNLLLKNNKGYSDNGRGTRIGYGGSVTEQTATLVDNYLAENFWVAGNWDQLNVSGTSVFHGITGSSQDQINELGGNDFRESNPKSGKKIFISNNKYDTRRARVIIYNYDSDEYSVAVDLSSVLKIGEAYRIHSVFDLFGKALLSGIFNGSEITIPMGSIAPPQPNGLSGIGDEDDPKNAFGVFIVTHAGCTSDAPIRPKPEPEQSPHKASDVSVHPIESEHNTINYFLLALPKPLAFDASVNYITRDGTAIAGEDYIATSGTAIIPAGSTYIAIAVELIGDAIKEENETFSLVISNPFGGLFPAHISEISATHTIIDND